MSVDIHNRKKDRGTVTLILMATISYIWLARNDLIFNCKPLSMNEVVEKIMVNVFLWLKYRINDLMWQNWYSS